MPDLAFQPRFRAKENRLVSALTHGVDYRGEWKELDHGAKLFLHYWACDGAAKTIVLVHGLGEHGGRYHNLAVDFVAAGYRVVSFDQQGHGNHPHKRGCIRSYASMLADISRVIEWAMDQWSQPVLLFGHSMGGNLVLNYTMRGHDGPIGVIASSPMIESSRRPPRWAELAARTMGIVFPDHQLKSTVIPSRIMSDPAEQELLKKDALFHTRLSLRLGAALLDSGDWLLKNASQLQTPTLVTHGTDDYLTSPEASRRFANSAGDTCQLEIFEGHLHDPFRGLERDVAVRRFVQFAEDCDSSSNDRE